MTPVRAVVVVALAGAGACGDARREPDAAASDVVALAPDEVDDADAGPPAPWTGGEYTLPRPAAPTETPPAWCGGARPVVAGGYWPDAHHACARDGWVYMDASGSVGRVRLADGRYEQLTGLGYDAPHAFVACQADGLAFAMHAFALQNDAFVQFTDVAQPGRVRWWLQRHPAPASRAWGGIAGFAAGDGAAAWVWYEPDGPAHFVVAGPHAEDPREVPVDDAPEGLTASGARVVYALDGDIWLWTAGTSAPENLTRDARGHASPWIDGERVVWEDAYGAAPGLYAMDLARRTRVRITQGAPADYRGQHAPVVAGDWVVWTDYRNATTVSDAVADRTEIWGYNFVTGREYPVHTGPYIATAPTILAGRVYFLCSPMDPTSGQYGMFVAALPTP